MKKNLKFLFAIVFLMFLSCVSYAQEDGEYVGFGDLKNFYGKGEDKIFNDALIDKKVVLDDNDSNFKGIYSSSNKIYIVEVTYVGQFRPLTKEYKEFLIKWNSLKTSERKSSKANSISRTLVENDLGLFYEEIAFIYKGGKYWMPIQKIIAEELRKELGSSFRKNIDVHLFFAGRTKQKKPIAVIFGYDNLAKIKPENKEKKEVELVYREINKLIERDKIQSALNKLISLKNRFPKNKEIALDICLTRSFTDNYKETIKCYAGILKEHPNRYEVYYGIGTVYYNDKGIKDNTRYSLAVKNFDKALGLLNRSQNKGVYFDILYKRALAKVALKDRSAISDLEEINKTRPDLVSEKSIDRIRKNLRGVR